MDAIACGGVERTEMEGKIEGLRVIRATYVCVFVLCSCIYQLVRAPMLLMCVVYDSLWPCMDKIDGGIGGGTEGIEG